MDAAARWQGGRLGLQGRREISALVLNIQAGTACMNACKDSRNKG